MTRPILRYFGGKFDLAPWIIARLPTHRVYVEPFGGAGSVLLQKPRVFAEIYNDLDAEVVNLFRVARDRGPEILEAIRLTPFARDEFELAYLDDTVDELERARRMVIRSFMSASAPAVFGRASGFRATGHRGNHSVGRTWASLVDAYPAIIDRLRGVVIENRPALEVIEQQDSPETLFYVDPPYVADTRISKAIYRHEMTDLQHRELAAKLGQVKGMVVLSGYHSPLYDELYGAEGSREWVRHEVSGNLSDGGGERTEVVWMRNVPLGILGLPL